MVRIREKTPAPETKKFKKDSLKADDGILFLDDTDNQWKVGVFRDWIGNVADENDLTMKVTDQQTGLDLSLPLPVPPQKITIPNRNFVINNQNFVIDPTTFKVNQTNKEVEVDLVDTTDPTNRIANINLDMVTSLEAAQTMEESLGDKVRDLKQEIHTKANARAKEILKKLTLLEQQMSEATEKLGSLDVWQEMDSAKSKEIGKQIKKLQKDISDALDVLKTELEAIKSGPTEGSLRVEATGTSARLDRITAQKKVAADRADQTALRDVKRAHEAWKKEAAVYQKNKKTFDDFQNLSDDKKRGKTVPVEPPPLVAEPTRPEEFQSTSLELLKIEAANELFESLESSPSANHKKIVDKVKERADKQAQEEGLADYNEYEDEEKQKVLAELFLKVLEEEKTRTGELATEFFDIKKEKAELAQKEKELRARAQALKLTAIIARLDTGKVVIEGVDGLPPAQAEGAVLQILDSLGEIELEIYNKERDKAASRELAEADKHQEDIDIPDVVLRELFADRMPQVRAVMEAIYSRDLSATDEVDATDETVLLAMKNLMRQKPDDYILSTLRGYGIKNWESFQTLWEEKLAKKSVKVLHEWGQDDLRSEVAKQMGGLDNLKALKWQIGARVLTNMVLVGGGALAATTIFASGGLAGIALAAAGGAAGGGVRALAQKFVFGSKWVEDRKKKQLEEMAEKKRQEIINNILDKRFGGKSRQAVTAETQAIFSSIMAEAIRDASAQEGLVTGGGAGEEAESLTGDSLRLYIQSLKNAAESGMDLSAEQKTKLALALRDLAGKTEQYQTEAVEKSDPVVIRLLDGVLAGYSGAKASSENYTMGSAAGTMALGAAAGTLFFSNSKWARGILGGLGGATAGYKLGESRRSKNELEKTQKDFQVRLDVVNSAWTKFLQNPGTLKADELRNFGDEIKKFQRYLQGNADTVAEEQVVDLLDSSPILKQQTENLIYQAYRRGVFARIALADMQQHTEEMFKDSQIKLADSTWAATKKFTSRALWTTGGAVLGAGSALLAGWGIQEMREYFGLVPHPDTNVAHQPNSPVLTKSESVVAATGSARSADLVPTSSSAQAESIPVPTPAPQPIESHAGGVHPVESAPARPGLVELHDVQSGEKISFSNWRHKIMEGMGYKFEGGKIAHPFVVHPGAKFELVGADGKTIDEFEFKKGDSTWRALDHFHKHDSVAFKDGAHPSIRIVGADTGKVQLLDHYKVEGHTGKKFDFRLDNEKPGVTDLPKDNFKGVTPNEHGVVVGKNGIHYEMHAGSKTGGVDYFVHGNHLYGANGKYAGEEYIPDKVAWANKGAIPEQVHKNLDTLLRGSNNSGGSSRAGGPAADALPSRGENSGGGVDTNNKGGRVVSPELPAKVAGVASVDKVETNFAGKATERVAANVVPEKIKFSPAEAVKFNQYLGEFSQQWKEHLQTLFNNVKISPSAKDAITHDVMGLIEKNQNALSGVAGFKADRDVIAFLQSPNTGNYGPLNQFIQDHASPETKLFLSGNENVVALAGAKSVSVSPEGSHAIWITQTDGRKVFVEDSNYNFALDNQSHEPIIGRGSDWRVIDSVSFDRSGKVNFNFTK